MNSTAREPDGVPQAAREKLPVAAIVHADKGAADPLLARFASRLRRRGRKVAGLIQEKTGSGKVGTFLVDLERGTRYSLFQDLGSGSTSCSVDTGALSAASAVLRRALDEKADIAFANRFGELEAHGGGFAAELLALMAEGVPLITAVSDDYLPAWRRFTEGAGTELPPHIDALERWFDDLRAVSPARTTNP